MAKRTLKRERTRTVKIAVTPEQYARWKLAAKSIHESLETFSRETIDDLARALVELAVEKTESQPT